MSAASTDRPLRILHLTLASDAGGLSQYIVTLGTAMYIKGHDISAAGDRGAWQWAFDESGVQYMHIPLKHGFRGFRKSVRIMRDYLRLHPVDVIHTHYRRATLLARKLQSPRVPILYTLHLSHISLKFPRNLFTDFGDYTHVASEDARLWLIDEAHVDPQKISLIPHGVEVNRFTLTKVREREEAREHFHLKPEDTVALFVGRLDDPKNEAWIIDVAAATRNRPDLKFFLVGEGPHEIALKDRIARERLTDRVFVVGHQDPLPYYRAADAILLPSLREGFSLVCAEAMATGIPAYRTQTSGTTELIVEGVTGHSSRIDQSDFVQGAIGFLKDRETLHRMGIAAAEHIRSRFSFDQQLSRTIDLYRSIAKVS